MTNERIAEIKAFCDDLIPGPWKSGTYSISKKAAQAITTMRQVIPELLEALEEAKHDAEMRIEAFGLVEHNLKAERDHLKARVEALERAIKAHKGNKEILCAACFMCIPACAEGVACHENNDSWQFDADRFECVEAVPVIEGSR